MTDRPTGGLESPALVRFWLLTGLVWAVLVPAVGALVSFQIHSPGVLPEEPWLSLGRLLPIHANAIVFALFTTVAFGLIQYMVPRLTGVPMAFGGLGYLTCLLWNAAMAGGFVLLAVAGYQYFPQLPLTPWMDFLFGGNQGIASGEFPVGIDILIALCFLITTLQVIVTVLRRIEPMLYVSLWYLLAALLWTTLNFILGNFVLPNVVGGIHGAALQGMYAGNLTNLWVVPAGLAVVYYFLPLTAEGPLHSYKLAWLGFWTLALFAPLVGVGRVLFAPVPAWSTTLAVAAGVCVMIPVWAVTCNFFGTLAGHWDKLRSSVAVKFFIVGALFYLMGSLMGAILGLRDVAQALQFTSCAEAAGSAVTFGGGVFWALGGAYAVWERTADRALWSEDLGAWHFWLCLLGFGLLFFVMVDAGVLQGSMLRYGADFTDAVAATRWSWFARTGANAMIGLGMVLFALNLLFTTRASADA